LVDQMEPDGLPGRPIAPSTAGYVDQDAPSANCARSNDPSGPSRRQTITRHVTGTVATNIA
jgi:hypothetical protein